MRLARHALIATLLCAGLAQAAVSDEEINRRFTELQDRVKALDTRIAQLEATLSNNSLVSLLSEVQQLREEVNKLRGRTDENANALSNVDKKQRDLYTDLDNRLRQLSRVTEARPAPVVAATATPPPEGSAARPPASAATSKPPAPVTTTPATPVTPAVDPQAESKAYEAALNLVRLGNYLGAISGLQGFLKTHPGSQLAPNAQYWIGYSYYASGEYKNSLASHQKLIAAYPNSAKVPDAMLGIAKAQLELKDVDAARESLRRIIEKYPLTTAAEIAKKRLENLK